MSLLALQAGIEPFPGCRLIQLRGRGGFSEVWEAEAVDGSRVALKFMPGSSEAAPREIRALQTIRQLRHPNLVRVERIWSQRDYIVISMELAEATLSELLDAYQSEYNQSLPANQVCFLLMQAAKAIDFLNKRQHVVDGHVVAFQHCDIKPSNMLLMGDTVKLSDFTLTTQASGRVQLHNRQGTLDYAAPEVFQGTLSDHSDQYSLAVSYCVLRTGRLPFPEVSAFRDSWPRKRPPADLSLLTEKERPILARALKTVPLERWPSCQEMMAQLGTLVDRKATAAVEAERRLAERRLPSATLSCQVSSGPNGPLVPAALRDFSLGGIGFISQDQIEQRSSLLVHLKRASSFARVLRAQVRHTTRQHDGTWLVGCTLVDRLGNTDLVVLSKRSPGHSEQRQ
jgi:serine/threonine-protein kinase